MTETISPISRRARHQAEGPVLARSTAMVEAEIAAIRAASRGGSGGANGGEVAPAAKPPSWAAGRRVEGVSKPAREPQMAQLYPGSRPIPVVYSPRAGVDILTPAGPNDGAGLSRDDAAEPVWRRPRPPAAPTGLRSGPGPVEDLIGRGDQGQGPRVAGPRVGPPSRPLAATPLPASAAISAVVAGATVRATDPALMSQAVPSPTGPLTGTLPGSVLAPRVEGGPSLARRSEPISRPLDGMVPASPAADSIASAESVGSASTEWHRSVRPLPLARPSLTPPADGPHADLSDALGPALPMSRSGYSAGPSDAVVNPPIAAAVTEASAPPYRPRPVAPVRPEPAPGRVPGPGPSPVSSPRPNPVRGPVPSPVGLSEPDWAAFDFADTAGPAPYPAAPPSRPVPVIPPPPNLSGEPVLPAGVPEPFAETQPPVYATGAMRAIAAPIRKTPPPEPVRRQTAASPGRAVTGWRGGQSARSTVTRPPGPARTSAPVDFDLAGPAALIPERLDSIGLPGPVDGTGLLSPGLFDPFSGQPNEPSADQLIELSAPNQPAGPDSQVLPWDEPVAESGFDIEAGAGPDFGFDQLVDFGQLDEFQTQLDSIGSADQADPGLVAPADEGDFSDTFGVGHFGDSELDGDSSSHDDAEFTALADPFGGPLPQADQVAELDLESDPFLAFTLSGPNFTPAVPPVSDPEAVASTAIATGPDQMSDAADQEAMWDPPPDLLPDGQGPWMVGPEAHRLLPKAGSGRMIVRVVFMILAGIALGAAIWGVSSYLRDPDDAGSLPPTDQVQSSQVVAADTAALTDSGRLPGRV